MATIAEALALAWKQYQSCHFKEAEHVCLQILQADPANAQALHCLGTTHLALGQLDGAEADLRRAIGLKPDHAGAYHCLGIVLAQQGKLAEAAESLRQALRFQPGDPHAHNNLGNVLRKLRRFDEAADCLRESLRLMPNQAEAHYNLGLTFAEQGKREEAIAGIRLALRFNPASAEMLHSLAAVLVEQSELDEAARCMERVVQLQPASADAHHGLGVVLAKRGKRDEAVASYQRALALQPQRADTHCSLAGVFAEQRKFAKAVSHFQQAVSLRPDLVDALHGLGNALKEQGKTDEAVASYRRVLQLQPDHAETHNNLGAVLKEQGFLYEGIAELRRAHELRPEFIEAHTNLICCLNYDPRVDAATLFAEHRRWAQLHGPGAGPGPRSLHGEDPERRLRVGYVSPDLRRHPVASFVEPILAHHDPGQVHVFCYADVPAPDAVTARLRALSHGWRSTSGLADEQVTELIRSDNIDILVDLAGHTANNRLRVFARKPAPVQVTYLGYPNTTGLAAVDYRLTDAVADPPGDPVCHTEELIRLPDGFCCFVAPDSAPDVTPLPAGRVGHVTFGALANLAKVNPEVIEVWCTLLRAVPSARLLLQRHTLTGQVKEYFQQQFAQRGIAGERIELRHAVVTGIEHLATYGEIDILLDTFPWCGHTMACEALWMGVPSITLYTDRHAGRMVASVLTTLGLTEFVARTREQYCNLAVQWAGDLERLGSLRMRLRDLMRASALCDGKRFARNLEAAYRQMWRKAAGTE